MPLSVQVQCPAKVNLFLEVTGKRKDGYHTLATLFAKIGIFDVLDLAQAPGGFELEVVSETGQALSAGGDNLVLRAAEAFEREFRLEAGARIRLTKRVPMGAGLGGGSSDAAGTLLGLVRLYGIEGEPRLLPRLRRLALGLGADVPFFLGPAPMCEGRGIGERLRAVRPAKSLPWMVLAYPGVAVSTKEVFGSLARPARSVVLTRLSQLNTLEKKLGKGRPIPEWEGLLFNRLEEGVCSVRPEVAQARDILRRSGLRGVLMSGSGSSVFGFAESREEGERALTRLKGYPWKVHLTCCLG